MDLLRISTTDYELIVRAEGADLSFRKAAIRNTSINNATIYNFSGANVQSFELARRNGILLENHLEPAFLNTLLHPVFFENKDYYFDIIFLHPVEAEPRIYSPLQEVTKSFISRKINDKFFLTGAINFRNDIGKSDLVIIYRKNGVYFTHRLNFEVFPIKLDYQTDYKNIIQDINREFSSLVLDSLRKTYSVFKQGNEVNNDLVWWSVFGQLYKNIISSSGLILNKPHNRLVSNNHFIKLNQIRQLNSKLEEQIAEDNKNENRYYQVGKRTLTIDTPENQFFKYAINYIFRRYRELKNKLILISATRISAEFRLELENIEQRLSIISKHPFFKQISDFRGLKQESLVLHKAAGYSQLFRSWIILKKGIDFLDGVNKIELKNIADLYQIWCFIEMKNVIQSLLNIQPEEKDLAEILIDGFTVQLRSGRNSKITFRKDNGDLIELFHELRYTNQLNDNTMSHTINQEPDIVLRFTKSDYHEKMQFTYLFDAKYRLISDDTEDGRDLPPDDAINQMHRYRDAIFYQTHQEDHRPKKEVIGAYVLFPGRNDSADVESMYFQKSISKVNIGAYPLVPGIQKFANNSLLVNFLRDTLQVKDPISILREEIAPYKSLKYEDPDPLVLAGFMGSEKQVQYFKSNNPTIYHLPVYKSNGSINRIKNLDKLKYFCPIINGISEYYEITDIKVIPRRDIFNRSIELYRDSDESYIVFSLANRTFLNNKIESAAGGNRIFRYARFSELMKCKSVGEFNKVHQES